MRKLILQIFGGIAGLWLATQFVPGVEFIGEIITLLLIGSALGLVNFFIKPLIKILTLPLRILTLGLFGLVINIGIIWAIDIFFVEIVISGILALLCTTLIIWGTGTTLSLLFPKKKEE